jgi:energy-coupling factor transporter ATP-binding protein EcfA2
MADGYTVRDEKPEDDEDGRRGPGQRQKIIDAVLDAGVKFWRDPDWNTFATVTGQEGEMARFRVRSRAFSMLVRQIYAQRYPTKTGHPGSVSDTALAEALPALEAMAIQETPREPEVRVLRDGAAIWIDLGDNAWRLVRVDAAGWKVMDSADIPLIRPAGMRALPIPQRGPKAMEKLRALLNLAVPKDADGKEDLTDLSLVVAWLLAALYPAGPYPVLALDGEQGSGKSTACKMLRRLIDPNLAEHRATPRSEDDLLIAAQNGRIVAIDNVSYLEADMADALCRLATGAGFSKRKLYSDGEEIIVSVARPVLLNGIPSLLARGDLADRALAITLPPIPDAARKPEAEVWQDFAEAAPGILALLLDGLAMALRRLPTLRLARLPRMADFARLACAAAPAFDWTEEQMLEAIEGNRRAAVMNVIESDPIAVAVQGIAARYPRWEGSATSLLELVNEAVPLEIQRERGYPKDAARLSGRLKRVSPALRRAGVEVVLPISGGRAGREIQIRREEKAEERSQRSTATDPAMVFPDPPAIEVVGNADERSGNANAENSVPDKPLNYNGRNAGNAGNAVLPTCGVWEEVL